MTANGLGPSPVCSTLARSGKVFLRMAMAAETLADGWESLSCMISASVSIASGVNFAQSARTSGSRLGRPPGLPLTPFLNGIIVLHCFQLKKPTGLDALLGGDFRHPSRQPAPPDPYDPPTSQPP